MRASVAKIRSDLPRMDTATVCVGFNSQNWMTSVYVRQLTREVPLRSVASRPSTLGYLLVSRHEAEAKGWEHVATK